MPDGGDSLRIQCILIGIFDLLFLACLYLSPLAPYIHLTSAVVWIMVPAVLLIIGAAHRNLHCMWPWVMNNFAVAYFFVFFSVEEIIGYGKFIKNINITLETIGSQSIDGIAFHMHIGPWIIFFVLVFLFSRLDAVVRIMMKSYETSIRQQILNAPSIKNEVKTITV